LSRSCLGVENVDQGIQNSSASDCGWVQDSAVVYDSGNPYVWLLPCIF